MVKTNKLVNWNRDIEETKLIDLFRAEYERCNIWPDHDSRVCDYESQINNTAGAVLWYASNMSETIKKGVLKNEYDIETTRANAIEAACQAIKVIAACNKWLRKDFGVSSSAIEK